jgi:hypothetical protein
VNIWREEQEQELGVQGNQLEIMEETRGYVENVRRYGCFCQAYPDGHEATRRPRVLPWGPVACEADDGFDAEDKAEVRRWEKRLRSGIVVLSCSWKDGVVTIILRIVMCNIH